MTDKPVSRYLLRHKRELCATCQERPALHDSPLCKVCDRQAIAADAQAKVEGLDERRDIKKWGG